MTIIPVILAGGRGTRLWPLSRADRPKQFLPLFGGESLFQRTVMRHPQSEGFAPPWIICGADYRFTVADELAKLSLEKAEIILEPEGRNTAPAIAAAAALAVARHDDAILFVLPSDHILAPDDAYRATLAEAADAARAGRMVTFGITPTYPETGYGYIAAGPAMAGHGRIASVAKFVEKPPAEAAARMIAEGDHYWNAGFFMFGAAEVLAELERHAPAVVASARKSAEAARRDLGFLRLGEEDFAQAPDISIDYALFENTDKASVAPIACRWSDVGSWRSFWETADKGQDGLVVEGDALATDTRDCLIVTDGKTKVFTLGVSDLAIVATEDATLVAHFDKTQNVKDVVAAVRASADRALTEHSRTCYRPWGGYASVLSGERFQVKRLFVLPGKTLSLQKHFHRAEHWVVVRGSAEVTVGEETRMLSENESTFIPVGTVHRLANPGRILLELIEVQTGSYLEEDDIVRLDDAFGRN